MIKRLQSCFDTHRVNTERQIELDIAKGFAIIFMVLCHTFEMLSLWTSRTLEIVLDSILGGPFSAAVFMFCMGVGICYSRHSQPVYLFRRGCTLLFIGLVLELCRDVIPNLIWGLASGVLTLSYGLPSLIFSLFNVDVDILQFAGLFFLFFAFLKKYNARLWQINLLALLFSVSGQLLRGVSTGSDSLDLLCGYVWRSHDSVWFPFLNWFIFPAAGYSFGKLWTHCKNKNAFYRTVTPVCWIITLLYLCLTYPDSRIYVHDLYYGMGTIDAFFSLILVMAAIGFAYFFAGLFKKQSELLCWMSANITSVYCVHWVILTILAYNMYFGIPVSYIPDALIVPSGLIILAVSCIIVAMYNRRIK